MLENEAADSLARRLQDGGHRWSPRVGIILGSGLGGIAERIEDPVRVPFAELPGFARSTAQGHRGEVLLGTLVGVPVLVLAGRFHLYEGWTIEQVTFPVRMMAAWGIGHLIVSNAAGGLRPRYRVGDLLVIRDMINLLPQPQFDQQPPVLHESPFDPTLGSIALRVGREHGFAIHQGTYLATLGPSYETRAEYRMMRKLGADCVGMSTVPEVLQAHLLGLRVLALSMISNIARPDAPSETTHAEVLDAGREAEPRMTLVVEAALRHLGDRSGGGAAGGDQRC